jgi:ABC-type polar amino acid transport system ATPase subunit
MMIQVTKLSKRYAERTILDDLSLQFEGGQVAAIVGPSGGGKSTLLRCVNGLERFDAGEVRVHDIAFGPGDTKECRRAQAAIRLRVGFVFQDWNLFAHRTALGNVIEAPVHVKKVPVAEATARGNDLLSKVGLAHRAGAYPHEMSGGEQQRVAIARALAMNPDALLLDEPTSALDPERTGEVLGVLRLLAKEGCTMILVTHEMAFAREVSHRIVVLHGGKVVEDGTPAEVLGAPKDARTRAFLRV